MELLSDSAEYTLRLGNALGAVLVPGDVVCLEGELGTGKTVVARGIAGGRGHREAVPSPTFLIIHTYPRVAFCHVDAFRLEGSADLIDAGIEEYLDGRWICAVEWAGRVRAALPTGALTVRLEFTPEDDHRRITVECPGEWGPKMERLRKELEPDAS